MFCHTRRFSELSPEQCETNHNTNIRRKRPRTSGPCTSASRRVIAPLRRTVTPEVVPHLDLIPRTQRRSSSVSFSEEIESYAGTPCLSEDADATKQWYTRIEYDQFKLNVKADVLHLASLCCQDSLGKVDFREQTVVGIERYCSSSNERQCAKNTRACLIRAVLDQQVLQRVTGMKDHETLRMMSELHSMVSGQQAIQRARAFR